MDLLGVEEEVPTTEAVGRDACHLVGGIGMDEVVERQLDGGEDQSMWNISGNGMLTGELSGLVFMMSAM